MRKDIVSQIMRLFKEHGQIPQGIKALGIKGRRDSDTRYKLYNLDAHLKPSFNVLDIGCNCGFLSCLIARRVNSVIGIDKDKVLIKAANLAAEALGLINCSFVCGDIKNHKPDEPYDLVVASQIHMWVAMAFPDYVQMLHALVKPGGLLLFESHDTQNVDKDIARKVNVLIMSGFENVLTGTWTEDPGQYWIPPKKHKKIPRNFYLMRSCRTTE